MAYAINKIKVRLENGKTINEFFFFDHPGSDIDLANREVIKMYTGITLDMNQYDTAASMIGSRIILDKKTKVNDIYDIMVTSILQWMNKIMWKVEPTVVDVKAVKVSDGVGVLSGISLDVALNYAIETANLLKGLNQTILEIHFPMKTTQNIVSFEKVEYHNAISKELALASAPMKSKFSGKKNL